MLIYVNIKGFYGGMKMTLVKNNICHGHTKVEDLQMHVQQYCVHLRGCTAEIKLLRTMFLCTYTLQ